MKKILIVDDEQDIVESLKFVLENCDYTCYCAYNGEDGLKLAREIIPDLIILDVMMPEVDGYTVAQKIRQNPDTKDIPILMLTALSQLQDKVKGFDIGVDDYLVKPFEMEELKVRREAESIIKHLSNVTLK